MKIGLVTSSLSRGDGWSIYSRGVFQTLRETPGVSVIALTGWDSEVPDEWEEAYTVLPPTRKQSFSLYTQINIFLICLLYLRGCDVIHTCYEKPMVGAALASKFLGATLVMTLHGTYAIPPKGNGISDRIKRRCMRFAYKTAAIATTGSFKTEDRVKEIIPEMPECRFIPNGFDDAIFRARPEIKREPRLLSVGWLKPRKGMDTVIEALALLKNEFPGLTYKMIGGDYDTEDMDYYDFLKRHAKRFGLSDRVSIRVGKISREELAKEYARSAVFVLVSRDSGGHFEGFPLVYMEGQACGTPIVTTEGYGSNYVVQNGVNGYLVGQDDPKATADAIRNIIRDPAVYAKMERGSFEKASTHTWKKIIPQILDLYRDGIKIKNSRTI